jgi:hypothetical protein
MGGFLRNMAPFAAVLQGQQQAQQQQISDQLNRALLMGKLQDMQTQQKALSGTSPDEQQFLNLGGNVKDWTSRQERTTKASSMADQMYQDAMDPSKPAQERMDLFQRAANMRAHPELIDLPENQRYGSGATKTPPPKPFHTFSTAEGEQAFEGYDASGNPIINRVGGNKPSSAGAGTELRQIYDPVKGTTSWQYVPKSGPAGSSAGEVRPPMGSNAIAESSATNMELSQLKTSLNALGASSGVPNWGRVALQKMGLASADPRMTDMLGQVSVINTTLTGLVMRSWGSRNAVAAQKMIDLHVPKPEDSPALIMQKIDDWQKPGGYLDVYKVMMGATGGDAGGVGPAAGPAAGPADAGKFKGTWAPDGREIWVRPDGSKYLK